MSNSKKSKLPPWIKPDESKGFVSGLRMANTLTLEKDLFVPQDGKNVKYYLCGPTVYDSSHMGHARTYLALDIMRRIMQDYFGYNLYTVMNITDIDDKIILKARQNHLLAEYSASHSTVDSALRSDLLAALEREAAAHAAKRDAAKADAKMPANERSATMAMFEQKIAAVAALRGEVEAAADGAPAAPLLERAGSALAAHLDAQRGGDVDMQTLYREHAAKYELEYLEDMEALGVRPPDVMTRVSEYLDEVVRMVERIIANGYAYEANGSVYFDTQAFAASDEHSYGKLEPWSVGDANLLADGEGALGAAASGVKRHPNDFALWKASKPGEPRWSSPWGDGRPGWHIECSAMASSLIDGAMDIHAGGMDLKFPHHDNELAQSEAFYPMKQWVNYFLHTGHLHIEGLKMSKSLKNFVTIREALQTCTARQLRLLFLFRQWDNVMNYSAAMLDEVRGKEKALTEFFLLEKQVRREQRNMQDFAQRWDDGERALLGAIVDAQKAVDEALKDNFDTPAAMKALMDLVGETNRYARSEQRRVLLIGKAAAFVQRMLTIFGVIGDNERSFLDTEGAGGADAADAVEPIAAALAKFRYDVREAAREKGVSGEALAARVQELCDAVRDETLPPLGVRLEDDPNFPAAFKIVDADALMKEIAEKRESEAQQHLDKLRKRVGLIETDIERAEAAAVTPQQLFAARSDEFSSFDDKGVPLTDASGEPLAKAAVKRVQKEYKAAQSKHEKWLAKGGEKHTAELRASLAEVKSELARLTK